MRITVISAERSVYDGDATAVVAPAYDGMVGVLPRHAPFMTLLGTGTLTVRNGTESRAFEVRKGFLQVENDVVRVVAQHAEEAKEVTGA
jgi:F-type H+-transporting ATPase subunit epsilon